MLSLPWMRTGSAQRLSSQYFAAVPIRNMAELVPSGFVSVHNHGFCDGPNTFPQKTTACLVDRTAINYKQPLNYNTEHTEDGEQFFFILFILFLSFLSFFIGNYLKTINEFQQLKRGSAFRLG